MTINRLARSIALQIAAIKRVFDSRDALLQEREGLRNALFNAEVALREAGLPVPQVNLQSGLPVESATIGILDTYVTDSPKREAAFHLFDGAWSSYIPAIGLGSIKLFDDQRIKWLLLQCGGVSGKRVLELGPLEGGHTWMLAKAGAQITSIESNTTSFLKCLVVKNELKFDADFLLGDFRRYLEGCSDTYDLVIASGVLYHMTEPIKLLQDIAKVTQSIAIWTHFYDRDVIGRQIHLSNKFDAKPRIEKIGARKVESYKQRYLQALKWKGFCGGNAPTSYWLTKESLLGVLTDLGFSLSIGHEQIDHPNGPAILLFATRK